MSAAGTPPTAARACPACGSRAVVATHRPHGKRDIREQPLVFVACACGTWYQPELPDDAALVRWYDYMGRNDRPPSALVGRRLARLARTLPEGRLLEIGCGAGHLVRAAASTGRQMWATEVSASCCALLRPSLGERLHEGDLQTVPFSPASFDGVVAIEVIEHLPDPLAYLRAARALLRPGGTAFLTTPNLWGSSGRLAGSRWRVVTDEHLHLFTTASVRALLDRAGFVDVTVETSGLDLEGLRALLPRRRTPASDRATAPGPAGVAPAAPAAAAGALVEVLRDVGIEAVNRLLGLAALGDTLRVRARRPD